jgi:hypothetical protein
MGPARRCRGSTTHRLRSISGIRAIQEALGHKSIAMTVRYSHLSPDFIQDAVDRLAPPEVDPVENRTDTTTDTSKLEAMETRSKSVH